MSNGHHRQTRSATPGACRHDARLVNLVQGFNAEDEAFPITFQLAKLANLLRVHLATEDEWFYPAMIASNDSHAASLTITYQGESGGIAEEVEAFIAQWNSSAVIDVGFERFQGEMRTLFAQIEDRIHREERILYPLARSLGIGRTAAAA